MKLWQYAVILEPTVEDRKAGKRDEIVVPVTTIVAKDAAEATMVACRAIPPEHADKTDRLEVAVRPF